MPVNEHPALGRSVVLSRVARPPAHARDGSAAPCAHLFAMWDRFHCSCMAPQLRLLTDAILQRLLRCNPCCRQQCLPCAAVLAAEGLPCF